MTLAQMMERSFRTYGKRNRLYIRSTVERINFLGFAIGDLQDAVRKGADKAFLASLLARIVSRIFCCVEAYLDLPFIEMMARKYPLVECGYCHKAPCGCGDRRKSVKLTKKASEFQHMWGLGKWCHAFEVIYGPANKKKGVENLILRLMKEVIELTQLDAQIPEFQGSMRELEEELSLELADTMAWTIAIANALEVDLEAEMESRYGEGCRKCGLAVCICTHFNKRQVYVNSTVAK